MQNIQIQDGNGEKRKIVQNGTGQTAKIWIALPARQASRPYIFVR